jgi:pimeloyl-ACP methyl ester carboxylesterase
MIKEGHGHHPHSLRDPAPIADFIEQSVRPPAAPPPPPAYVGDKFTRTRFYGATSSYREFPTEGTYVTCRGPMFSESYDRYAFDLPGVEGAVTVIEPNRPADGSPWVFRADHVGRDALVDLALLGKGFRVVTGPVYHNADGPKQAYWDAVYGHLTRHGFSKKPVLEGSGGAAGEMYAWAVANPARVSCVYAENPVLRSTMTKAPLFEEVAALARADVPLLHVCGERDPAFDDNTRALEIRYKALGGRITVIVKEGEGHFPPGPRDPDAVVDFITHRAK